MYRFHALVTTYEVIIQDVELLSQIYWRVCIIDEAHRLKNQKCKLSEGLKVKKRSTLSSISCNSMYSFIY